jgi:hypothetical protein
MKIRVNVWSFPCVQKLFPVGQVALAMSVLPCLFSASLASVSVLEANISNQRGMICSV